QRQFPACPFPYCVSIQPHFLHAVVTFHANSGDNSLKLATLIQVFVFAICGILAAQSVPDSSKALAEAETLFAHLADAHYIVATIDSGLFNSYRGKDRAAWQKIATDAQNQLTPGLAAISPDTLSPTDQRALFRLRSSLEYFAEAGVPPV